MATFKVSEAFDADIAELNAAGFNVNTNVTEVDSITAMETANMFYQQHQAIKELLILYSKLITKEAGDFRKMAEDARELDQTLVVRITG